MAASTNSNIMKRLNRAFTLIELQISSAIALIALSAIFALYLFSWQNFAIGNTFMDVYANSRNASGWLMRDIRCAAMVVPSHGAYTTTDNSIVLMAPSINPDGSVMVSNYDYIIYELRDAAQGKDMYRIVQKNASSSRVNEERVIARYCNSLTFSSLYEPTGEVKELSFYDGSTSSRELSKINTVSISLPINKPTTSASGAGTQDASLVPTTVVRLRNK